MTLQGQLTVYCGCTPVVDAQHEFDGPQTFVGTLITAVAEAAGVDPTDLPPLHHTIDLEALSKLFDEHDGAADTAVILSFEFESWNVFVRDDGRIRICDGTQPIEPAPVFESEAV